MKILKIPGCLKVSLVAVVALVLVPVVLFEILEEPHVTYATYEEMLADGAMARGWVPAFVPPSATDFEERHNLDTNASWLRFAVPKDALPEIEAVLTKVDRDSVVFPREPGGWWRVKWPGDLTLNGPASSRYTFYRHDYTRKVGGIERPERDFVALDASSGTIWHWRP